MSGIATLFNVPTTVEELGSWATAHMAHHRDINRGIYQLTGISFPEFILDPIDPRDTNVWEDQHQLMHTNMDAVLGIGGFDLSNVDFTKPELLAGWIQLNANEHYQASNILQIG